MAFLAQASSPEYQVKAAFVYNFTKFVEWPPQAFPRRDSPLKICIFGHDPFRSSIEEVIQSEGAEERPRIVERPQTVEELRTCHVAFIANSERERFGPLLNDLSRSPVLTVGESPDFWRAGGMINFTIEQNRVRFAVNLGRAERALLRVSSKLLRLATSVRSG